MRSKTILKIGISCIFLAYISFKIDLKLLAETILSVQPEYYFISFIIVIMNSVVLAKKYKTVMNPSGIYQSLTELIKINFICRFYSMFLTPAVGQSVIRWHFSTKNQEGRLKFMAVMLFERSTFFFALFFTVIISFALVPGSNVNIITSYIDPLLTVGLGLLFLFYFYLNYQPLYRYINRILPDSKNIINSTLMRNLYDSIRTFSIYQKQRKLLFIALGLSFVWHFLFLLRVYLLVLSIKIPLDFIHVTWMASLVLLIQVLPISLNGLGVRETAYAFLFGILDLNPESGVLLGILLFSQMFLMSALGGGLHLFSKE
jgi:uncharacterized protein (TIRG00374 family)